MTSRPVKITDTTLRDAHQSLMATRMRTEHMVDILEKMEEVGYHSLEVWGGATFDTCMRFLDEDPWERLWALKKVFKKTKLQMLLRGQNLVGYRHYADDVVKEFVKRAVAGGIDIVRIFDALNDTRNMEVALQEVRREGGHAQVTLSYTISPVHNIDYFADMAAKLEDMGAHSICIKDMAGLISPFDAYELVTKMKKRISIPVQLHCHYTSGMASMAYLKAIEAGVDVIDTATASLALGTSQPPTDTLVAALKGTPYDTGLNQELLSEVSDYFKEVRKNYHIPLEVAMGVDTNVLSYQIPGGMISNLASQLEGQKASHLLGEVLKEVPRVREELGYPPLVTPTSQIVGTQAVFNVMLKERYKMVSSEVKNYLRGYYGRPPGPVDEELRTKILGQEEPISVRPADLLPPQLEKAKEELGDLLEKKEDLLSYVLFPQVARSFLRRRRGLEPPLEAPGKAQEGKQEPKKEHQLHKIFALDANLILTDEERGITAYPA